MKVEEGCQQIAALKVASSQSLSLLAGGLVSTELSVGKLIQSERMEFRIQRWYQSDGLFSK